MKYLYPHGSGSYTVEEAESLEELEAMYNSKKTVLSKHNRTDMHRNYWRLWQCTQGLNRFKPDTVVALKGRREHKVPPLIRTCLQLIQTEKEKSISANGIPWVYYLHCRTCPMHRSIRLTTTKKNFIFFCNFCLIWLSLRIFFLSYQIFLLLLLFFLSC